MSLDKQVLNGRYQLEKSLGKGGMAEVYLAEDMLLKRLVAIKILFPKFASDANFVERFRREAQAAANLNHPNIVSVHDYGQHDSTYFIVMEYVEGSSLAELLKSSSHLELATVLQISQGVAAGLSFAHDRGIVHRDVKPGNIMIGKDGVPKVSDFGIARALDNDRTQLTQVGSVVGTAIYFSPEQAQGKTVDSRSDLYSLGIVMYQMINGVPPFIADSTVALALKHIQEPPPAVNLHNKLVPPSLISVVEKLLAKAADDRYATAKSLITDLQSVDLTAAKEVEGSPQTQVAPVDVPTADVPTAEVVQPENTAPNTEGVQTVQDVVDLSSEAAASAPLVPPAPAAGTPPPVANLSTPGEIIPDPPVESGFSNATEIAPLAAGAVSANVASMANPAAPPSGQYMSSPAPNFMTPQPQNNFHQPEKKKSRTGLFFALGAAVLLIALASVGAYLVLSDDPDDQASEKKSSSDTTETTERTTTSEGSSETTSTTISSDGNNAAIISVLADEIYNDDSFGYQLTRSESECAATKLVEEIGFEELLANEEPSTEQVLLILECIDLRASFSTSMQAEGATKTEADCFAEQLSDESINAVLIAEIEGSEPSDEVLSEFVRAGVFCS